jgi:peptide chain release factor subunit 1
MQKLLEEIRKSDGGLASYGEDQVRHALAMGAVDTLLISEGLRKKRVTISCPQCGWSGQLTVDKDEDARCPKCPQATPTIESSVDFVDAFYEDASKTGTKVELLSVDSEEGELLMKAFGGIAAILRYGIGGM